MGDVVYTTNELDLGTCHFIEPTKDEAGVTRSNLSHKNKAVGIVIQTSKINLRESNEVVLELLINRNKERHRELYHIISHLEDTAINQIVENSTEWFKRPLTRVQVEEMFKSSLNRPLEIDAPFIFRVHKKENLRIESNFPVICLIKIDGIIYGKTSCRLDMKVVKTKVIKPVVDQDVQSTTSSFYNDIASLAPANFNPSSKVASLAAAPVAVEPAPSVTGSVAASIATPSIVEPAPSVAAPVAVEPVVAPAPSVTGSVAAAPVAVEPAASVTGSVAAAAPVAVEPAASVTGSVAASVDAVDPLMKGAVEEEIVPLVEPTQEEVKVIEMTGPVSEAPISEAPISEAPVSEAPVSGLEPIESVAEIIEPVNQVDMAESLKVDLMRAVVDNDFARVQELNAKLSELNV